MGSGSAEALLADLVDAADAANKAALLTAEAALRERAAVTELEAGQRTVASTGIHSYRVADRWYSIATEILDWTIATYAYAAAALATTAAATAAAVAARRPMPAALADEPITLSAVLAEPEHTLPLVRLNSEHRPAATGRQPAAPPTELDTDLVAYHRAALDAVTAAIDSGLAAQLAIFDNANRIQSRSSSALLGPGLDLARALHRYGAQSLLALATLTATQE